MNSNLLTQPLSKAELDRLQAFLVSETTPERCLNLEGLDGFLTALVCGPETVLPSEFVDAIWGGGEVVWESQEQAQEIFLLIMRHWNSIVAELQADKFAPILDADEKEFQAADWAAGFIRGMGLRGKAWQPMLKDPERKVSLLIVLASLTRGEKPQELKVSDEERATFVRQLPQMVMEIHRYWLPLRQAEGTLRAAQGGLRSDVPRPGPKVGRNQLCPCGSGRKFKQCCGATSGRN